MGSSSLDRDAIVRVANDFWAMEDRPGVISDLEEAWDIDLDAVAELAAHVAEHVFGEATRDGASAVTAGFLIGYKARREQEMAEQSA
jgi:hypothetical protein